MGELLVKVSNYALSELKGAGEAIKLKEVLNY